MALGYDDVTEPAVVAKFPLKGREKEFVLAWTTTPWTLPGNVALAVGADIEYVRIRQGDEHCWLARDCIGIIRGEHEVVESRRGRELEGWTYEPIFRYHPDAKDPHVMTGGRPKGWYVTTADFVATAEGTGVVHTAVMYGEDDYNLGMAKGLPARHTVDAQGKFTQDVTPWAGRFVKEVEKEITADLRARGLLYRADDYTHSYPFCWRCSTPLLYYARDSWFIAMSRLRARMQELNAQIDWHPAHLKEGRFGDFLGNLKDWALSRERFWGTPLPIWTCGGGGGGPGAGDDAGGGDAAGSTVAETAGCGHRICIGAREEFARHGGTAPPDLHRPFIDQVRLDCPNCGRKAAMLREPYLIDVWYDSGCAPFAQRHYPFENREAFRSSFPVDYIAEAIDQTRGWFYTLLAISCAVEDTICYRRVLCTGLILDKDGQKMSKSKGNVVDPWTIFNGPGADALRLFMTATPAWTDLRFNAEEVVLLQRRVLHTLWNSYAFFASYAHLDGFDPEAEPAPPRDSLPGLDRWLLSRLTACVAEARAAYDGLEIHRVVRAIESFVVEDLSTWYIRRSRDRAWAEPAPGGGLATDKRAFYTTIHRALMDTVRLLAPIAPFIADDIYRRLAGSHDSVHLDRMPEAAADLRDQALEEQMALVRELTELGRRLRNDAGVRTRQPLPMAGIHTSRELFRSIEHLLPLLAVDLNVKRVVHLEDLRQFQRTEIQPDQAVLGRLFRKTTGAVIDALRRLDAARVRSIEDSPADWAFLVDLVDGSKVQVPRSGIRMQIVTDARYRVATVRMSSIVLDLTLDDELKAEGLAREIIRNIQQHRKELDLPILEVVATTLDLAPAQVGALEPWKRHIASETRSSPLAFGPVGDDGKRVDLEGEKLGIAIRRTPPAG